MAKLVENTYRDVNIALANEIAGICVGLGINAWEVRTLVNHHPRVNLHRPGPGVGGHCLPVDPWFIVERFPGQARLIRTSREVNDDQPRYVAELVAVATKGIETPTIAVLGVSYKANSDDTRETPAREIVRLLQARGCVVRVHDPHAREFDIALSDLETAARDCDCVLLLTDHDEFRALAPLEIGSLMRRRIVVDTRSFLDIEKWRDAGFRVFLLGKGD
jgi:UDP-N-acetyl-D-mannosaminuronic acid dehydrogenase